MRRGRHARLPVPGAPTRERPQRGRRPVKQVLVRHNATVLLRMVIRDVPCLVVALT